MKQLSDGIFLIGRYGPVKCGAWLLKSQNEVALYEMPEYDPGDDPPFELARKFIDKHDFSLKYVLLSHPHLDHYDSIIEYRETFPQAQFIGHKIFSYIINYKCSAELLQREELWKALPSSDRVFNLLFEDNVIELPLGDKTISIIYAPKHSPGDTVMYFNNVLFTGDWWMLEGDPGNCEEVARIANKSIKRVFNYIDNKKLEVCHIFPSHANNFLYNIDFLEVMSRTLMPAGREKAKECPEKIIRTL